MLTIKGDAIMIENYRYLLQVETNCIRIQCQDREIVMQGEKFHICSLTKDEIMIKGCLKGLQILYEK